MHLSGRAFISVCERECVCTCVHKHMQAHVCGSLILFFYHVILGNPTSSSLVASAFTHWAISLAPQTISVWKRLWMPAKDKVQTLINGKIGPSITSLIWKITFFFQTDRKGKSQIGKGTKDKSPFRPERNYRLLSDLGGDSTWVPGSEMQMRRASRCRSPTSHCKDQKGWCHLPRMRLGKESRDQREC